MKVFVISQPKAGTYLLSNVLKELGITPTNFHIGIHKYEDYSCKDNNAASNPKKYSKKVPISKSLMLVSDNSFAVGHIPYTDEYSNLLKDFRKVLITRNINDIQQSWNRFNIEQGRKIAFDPNLISSISKWSNTDIFHLTFEDIVNKNIVVIDKLQEYLFGKICFNSADILNQALLKDSLTKSSIRK